MLTKGLTLCYLWAGTVICWQLWTRPEALWWMEKLVVTGAMIVTALKLVREDFMEED